MRRLRAALAELSRPPESIDFQHFANTLIFTLHKWCRIIVSGRDALPSTLEGNLEILACDLLLRFDTLLRLSVAPEIAILINKSFIMLLSILYVVQPYVGQPHIFGAPLLERLPDLMCIVNDNDVLLVICFLGTRVLTGSPQLQSRTGCCDKTKRAEKPPGDGKHEQLKSLLLFAVNMISFFDRRSEGAEGDHARESSAKNVKLGGDSGRRELYSRRLGHSITFNIADILLADDPLTELTRFYVSTVYSSSGDLPVQQATTQIQYCPCTNALVVLLNHFPGMWHRVVCLLKYVVYISNSYDRLSALRVCKSCLDHHLQRKSVRKSQLSRIVSYFAACAAVGQSIDYLEFADYATCLIHEHGLALVTVTIPTDALEILHSSNAQILYGIKRDCFAVSFVSGTEYLTTEY